MANKTINNKQNIASKKNSQEFLASRVPDLKRNIANNSSTSKHQFFSCTELKALVLGNLLKLFRLDITFVWEVYGRLGIKMKKNMTIVLFFSLSPVANCPCECDGKSYKLE